MPTTVDPDLVAMMRTVLRKASLVDRTTQRTDELDRDLWQQLAELGLVRLTQSEDLGGSGASWHEAAALLAEAAGAAAHLPLGETDLLASWLLDRAGRSTDDAPTAVVFLTGDRAASVAWAGEVERLVVVRPGPSGAAAEVARGSVTLTPAGASSSVRRHDVVVPTEVFDAGVLDLSPDVLDAAWLRGALVRSIQSVGAMERILELCLEHTTTRVQFGRAISRFQTVQNAVSDMATEVALSRAAVDAAVDVAAETGLMDDTAAFRVAVAKSCTAHATSSVIRSAHQLHGAIGTTREHPLHLLTQPLLDWRSDVGNADHWDRRVTTEVTRHAAAWPLIAAAD